MGAAVMSLEAAVGQVTNLEGVLCPVLTVPANKQA